MTIDHPRIAALPMYDLPGLRPATDAFWRAVGTKLRAAGLAAVPLELTCARDLVALWRDPDLLFAQACGLPFVTLLDGRVRFVATPVYALDGCEGGRYRSWIVVAEASACRGLSDLEGEIAAINDPHSQSGANALAAATAPFAQGRPFFGGLVETGSHAASIAAVREGTAACAAIDCVTYGLLAAIDPRAIRGVRILAATPPAPALPFITAKASDAPTVTALRAALEASIDPARDPVGAAAARTLGLAGISADDASAYETIRAIRQCALEQGCARLAARLLAA